MADDELTFYTSKGIAFGPGSSPLRSFIDDQDKAAALEALMPRCETCRFWERDPTRPIDEPYRVCVGVHRNNRASVAYDLECYDLWLETGPDFGCVEHEPRDLPKGTG